MTGQTLRSLRDTDTSPEEAFAAEDLEYLVERAVRFATFPLGNNMRAVITEATADPADPDAVVYECELELADDESLRSWLLSRVPSALRVTAELADEFDRRPFPLEVVDGDFNCAACGERKSGRHIQVVDLLANVNLIDDPYIRGAYCADCATAAVHDLTS